MSKDGYATVDGSQYQVRDTTPLNPHVHEMTTEDVDPVNRMNIKEFLELGFLQEANRLFFHPRGLALEVTIDKEEYKISGVWDYRDDPGGIFFYFSEEDLEKAIQKSKRVQQEFEKNEEHRKALMGSAIQPLRNRSSELLDAVLNHANSPLVVGSMEWWDQLEDIYEIAEKIQDDE